MTEVPNWAIGAGVLGIIGFLWQTAAAIFWKREATKAQQDAERWGWEVARLLENTEAFRESVARGALEKMGYLPMPPRSSAESAEPSSRAPDGPTGGIRKQNAR